MAEERAGFKVVFDSCVVAVTLSDPDFTPVRIKDATGYSIVDGYLMVYSGENVIACFNHDKWTGIRR